MNFGHHPRMRERALLLSFLLCGCTGTTPEVDKAPSEAEGTAKKAPEPATPEPATPEPAPKPEQQKPVEPFVPTTPFMAGTIIAPPFECAELPKSRKGPTLEIARALRRVACEPELFLLPEADVEAKLEVQNAAYIQVYEPRKVSFELKDPGDDEFDDKTAPTLAGMAKALGIDKPVARLDDAGAKWWLDSGSDDGKLARFGPGVIEIQIEYPGAKRDQPGQAVPLNAEMVILNMWVRAPEHVLELRPDVEGMTQLTTALQFLAANPEKVTDLDLHEQLKMTDERWSPGRTTDGSSGETKQGYSVWVNRTVVPLGELLEKMGLVGEKAPTIVQEYNYWHLEFEASRWIPWNGLTLKFEVKPLADGKDDPTFPITGARLSRVTVFRD